VKKLKKEKTAPNIASQPPKKKVQNERDEKMEYTRSVFFNARPHIKSGIGYKNGDNHNSRMNTNDQEFMKFTKTNVQQIMLLILILILPKFLICHTMILMFLMCL
jgi:hypothetical protein